MARTYSFNFTTGVPCLLYTITRIDATVERVTDADKNITIGATTWTRHGGLTSNIRTVRSDGTPPSMSFNVQLASSSPLKFSDVDQGKYEGAHVLIQVTNAANPLVADFEFEGEIRGNVVYDPHGLAQFDLMSFYAIPRDIMVKKFTLPCGWDFGDPETCTVPVFPYSLGGDLSDVARSTAYALGARRRVRFAGAGNPSDYANVYLEVTTAGTTAGSAPSFSSTVGATTADGSVVWTTRNAWARYAQVSAVAEHSLTLTGLVEPRATVSTWFSPAKIMFGSGVYKGRVFQGSNWNPANQTIQIYLPCSLAAVNDWIEIAKRCDLTHEMCHRDFNNAANHFGFNRQQGAKAQALQLGLT